MAFALVENNEISLYPAGFLDLKRKFKNVSFPKNSGPFEEFGYVEVTATDQPTYNEETSFIEELTPSLVDGQWQQQWRVVDLTDEQIALNSESKALSIKDERNSLLQRSDWTQLPDAPVDAAAWATYRQALRDLPSQSGFPFNITWPTQP